MKQCSKCRVEKPSSYFNKDRVKKDGLQHYCRVCQSDLYKKTSKTDSYKGSKRKSDKKYRDNNKQKVKARNAVMCALKAGRLTKQPCEVCGELKVGGHHADYSKPLDVQWLCNRCHWRIDEVKETETMQGG